MGRARDRLDAGLTKVRRRLHPDFTLAAVQTEGRIVRLQIVRVHLLHGFRDLAMEKRLLKRQESAVDDLTDSLMGEVEALSDTIEDAPPHKLLNTFGRVANAETSGCLQNAEFEFTAD